MPVSAQAEFLNRGELSSGSVEGVVLKSAGGGLVWIYIFAERMPFRFWMADAQGWLSDDDKRELGLPIVHYEKAAAAKATGENGALVRCKQVYHMYHPACTPLAPKSHRAAAPARSQLIGAADRRVQSHLERPCNYVRSPLHRRTKGSLRSTSSFASRSRYPRNSSTTTSRPRRA